MFAPTMDTAMKASACASAWTTGRHQTATARRAREVIADFDRPGLPRPVQGSPPVSGTGLVKVLPRIGAFAKTDVPGPIALNWRVRKDPLGSRCRRRTTLLILTWSAAEWVFATTRRGCVRVGRALRARRVSTLRARTTVTATVSASPWPLWRPPTESITVPIPTTPLLGMRTRCTAASVPMGLRARHASTGSVPRAMTQTLGTKATRSRFCRVSTVTIRANSKSVSWTRAFRSLRRQLPRTLRVRSIPLLPLKASW